MSLNMATDQRDLQILAYLEDIEKERINFGLYETYVSKADILKYAREKGESLGKATIEKSLNRLTQEWWVLKLDDDSYRSRISEIVRLLKNVKQRFKPNDAQQAPYLIQSIRVEFENRRRLKREISFKETIAQLLKANRSTGLAMLDVACKAVQDGFCQALQREIDKVKLTPVQQQALVNVTKQYVDRDGEGYVITGNTGSGKTEAAILPLLIGALQEKLNGIEGCKIILVYPRQTLAKNQLERVTGYLASINKELGKVSRRGVANKNLTVGIAFGDTPFSDDDLKNGDEKYNREGWQKKGEGFKLPYFTDQQGDAVDAVNLKEGVCTLKPSDNRWELENFKATRKAIKEKPPDVLIITTEMLHRWLIDPEFNAFFGLPTRSDRAPQFCAPRAVVFDEIHLYDTIHGAQVGLLIRRLRYRLEQAMADCQEELWQKPLVLGMSATIGSPEKFWKKLSGISKIYEISPQSDDLEDAQGREYFLFIRPEVYSRGKRVGDASTAIQTIMAIAHNMRRRAGEGQEPAKFRSLIFQDSISKVKKLAMEFYDAESNKNLANYRFTGQTKTSSNAFELPSFQDGEYWYFDVEDPAQYSKNRNQPGQPPSFLTSKPFPVYSGGGKGDIDILLQDIIFATTALEVGYDDPSIQFVLQHHAPRNPASFVQKKGRAGRSLQDRPITAVTLSRSSYKDAFYYQNPQLLYAPSDYRPPLNVDNYFVQRFQTIALIFDELARLTHKNLHRGEFDSIENHLDAVEQALNQPGVKEQLESAYQCVTSESFQRVEPTWRGIWEWFNARMLENDIRYNFEQSNNLLALCPDLPNNLFSTINLPTIRVMFSKEGTQENWGNEDMDIALAFSEFAPGRVTRRYSRDQLYWRGVYAKVISPSSRYGSFRCDNAVAIERYKERDGKTPGPFNPEKLLPLVDQWGTQWQDYLPLNVQQVYDDILPNRFYRVQYLELWSFGQLSVTDPRRPSSDWFGVLQPDSSVKLSYDYSGNFTQKNPEARPISPDSNSYPLSFSVVLLNIVDGQKIVPKETLQLPPWFKGLADSLEFYYGEVGENRSLLKVWEVQYGAEARIKLLSQKKNDPHAGIGQNRVKYISEHDGQATLYGYDLQTEGIRIPYERDRLRQLAEQLFDEIWQDSKRQHHLQDQYLRFLLKSSSWQPKALKNPLNDFDLRKAADLIATMRAESRAEGVEDWKIFLQQLTCPENLNSFIEMIRRKYWRDHRTLTEEFLQKLRDVLTYSGDEAPRQLSLFEVPQSTRDLLEHYVFSKLTKKPEVVNYLMDNIIHSLKQATKNLFLTEGSTRDEEVGSHSVLTLTYGKEPQDTSFYVYERNQDGNGATRLVFEVLQENPAHFSTRWWETTLSCPVGDEEDFIKTFLRKHSQPLLNFQKEFFQSEPKKRKNPKDFVVDLVKEQIKGRDDNSWLQRLAGLLTSELSIAGRRLPRISVQIELLHLEDELAERFKRPATPVELAGYTATQVEKEPTKYPELSKLMEMYQEHSRNLGLDDEDIEDTANALDRFLDQIQQMSLSTCVDSCPACLSASCDHGHIDVMQHTISRRYLNMAYRNLTKDLTYEYGREPVENLVEIASHNGGYVILENTSEPDPTYLLALENQGFEQFKRDFDPETLVVRQVFYRKTHENLQ